MIGAGFAAFAATLGIGFISLLAVTVLVGVLCFGRYALWPVQPDSIGAVMVLIVELIGSILPAAAFLWFFQRKNPSAVRRGIWIGGLVALMLNELLLLSFSAFHVN